MRGDKLGYSYEHFSCSRAHTTSKSRQVTSKCQGGLGTGSISAKTKALIFKWLWRYGNLDINVYGKFWSLVFISRNHILIYLLRWLIQGGSS